MIKGIDYIGSTSDTPPEPQMSESEESPSFIHPTEPGDQVSQSILAERRAVLAGSSFEPAEAPDFIETAKERKETPSEETDGWKPNRK